MYVLKSDQKWKEIMYKTNLKERITHNKSSSEEGLGYKNNWSFYNSTAGNLMYK